MPTAIRYDIEVDGDGITKLVPVYAEGGNSPEGGGSSDRIESDNYVARMANSTDNYGAALVLDGIAEDGAATEVGIVSTGSTYIFANAGEDGNGTYATGIQFAPEEVNIISPTALKVNGQDVAMAADGGGGGTAGAWELVAEATTNGAANQFDVTGLDLQTDRRYHIEVNPTIPAGNTLAWKLLTAGGEAGYSTKWVSNIDGTLGATAIDFISSPGLGSGFLECDVFVSQENKSRVKGEVSIDNARYGTFNSLQTSTANIVGFRLKNNSGADVTPAGCVIKVWKIS